MLRGWSRIFIAMYYIQWIINRIYICIPIVFLILKQLWLIAYNIYLQFYNETFTFINHFEILPILILIIYFPFQVNNTYSLSFSK